MNKFEIEQEIVGRIKNIRSQEDLVILQKWAKKENAKIQTEEFVTSIKRMYYSFEVTRRGGSGSKAVYRDIKTVDYTAFIFFGIEIRLPEGKYQFPESVFNKKNIWVDRKIKWGGVEFFPKERYTTFFGIDMKQMFIDFLKENKYFILNSNTRYYLCNSKENARKILHGRRLNRFDLCNNQTVKIRKDQLSFFVNIIPFEDYETINPANHNEDLF
jgi:hypothetical protein